MSIPDHTFLWNENLLATQKEGNDSDLNNNQ